MILRPPRRGSLAISERLNAPLALRELAPWRLDQFDLPPSCFARFFLIPKIWPARSPALDVSLSSFNSTKKASLIDVIIKNT